MDTDVNSEIDGGNKCDNMVVEKAVDIRKLMLKCCFLKAMDILGRRMN